MTRLTSLPAIHLNSEALQIEVTMNMDLMPFEAGIRRIGFAMCYEFYREAYGRYPENPTQLQQVTTSVISEKRFQKYVIWWLETKAKMDQS